MGRQYVRGRVVQLDTDSATVLGGLGTERVILSRADRSKLQIGDWLCAAPSSNGSPTGGPRFDLLVHEPSPLPGPRSEFARVAVSGLGQRLAARSLALQRCREYFTTNDFIEVDAPARVLTPGLDVHVQALPAGNGWLSTSPEFFHKRLLAGGLPRLYQLAHCFRADESGAWHEPEFMMLEWYRAFEGVEAVMADAEALVRTVVASVTGKPGIDTSRGEVDLREPFLRITVRDAFERFGGGANAFDLAETDEAGFFQLLVDRVEPGLSGLGRPVFLTDYPSVQASLARRKPGEPRAAERFELYLDGVELCNGFGELTDAAEQRDRFLRDQQQRRERGYPVYPLDERFLRALEEGIPPCAGNALGMDRLIALALGCRDIQSVVPFPDSER